MNEELITVIVPVYKVEAYIHRCINSLLKQTYKNLEIILVDDGSPDKCAEICDEYALIEDRIKVIHKKNGGLSDARNKGIDAAKGNLITFIDSDDWVHEEYIERLYHLLKDTNSDITVCDFIRTSSENFEVNSFIKNIEFTNIEALAQLTSVFYLQMVVAWGKLYKRELFEEIRFPEGKIHEDEFTTYRLLFKARKITLTTAQLLYYWQREDSIMGSAFNMKSKIHLIEAYEERSHFYNDNGLEDLESKTYRSLFVIYINIFIKANVYNNEYDEEKLNFKFNDLKTKLRKSNQKISFKVFYELYYVAPKIMGLVYKKFKGL